MGLRYHEAKECCTSPIWVASSAIGQKLREDKLQYTNLQLQWNNCYSSSLSEETRTIFCLHSSPKSLLLFYRYFPKPRLLIVDSSSVTMLNTCFEDPSSNFPAKTYRNLLAPSFVLQATSVELTRFFHKNIDMNFYWLPMIQYLFHF